MKLPTISGDLLHLSRCGSFDVIIHCQNCFHGWKKGIVVQLKECFYDAYLEDLKTPKGCKEKLGTYSSAVCHNKNKSTVIVANLYAQYSFGQGMHLNMEALEKCLKQINIDFASKKIGYPKIGSGRAGGCHDDIITLIDKTLTNVDHQLVILTDKNHCN